MASYYNPAASEHYPSQPHYQQSQSHYSPHQSAYHHHYHHYSYSPYQHHQSHYPQHHHQQHYDHHHSYGHHYPSYDHHHNDDGFASASSLLIPLLGLIGLSLVVPNMLGAPPVLNLRNKRQSTPEEEKHAQALAEIYSAVLSSETCIQKLYCEMGHLAKHAKDKKSLFRLIDQMVPPALATELAILKHATQSSEYVCERYKCDVPMKNQGQPSLLSPFYAAPFNITTPKTLFKKT